MRELSCGHRLNRAGAEPSGCPGREVAGERDEEVAALSVIAASAGWVSAHRPSNRSVFGMGQVADTSAGHW